MRMDLPEDTLTGREARWRASDEGRLTRRFMAVIDERNAKTALTPKVGEDVVTQLIDIVANRTGKGVQRETAHKWLSALLAALEVEGLMVQYQDTPERAANALTLCFLQSVAAENLRLFDNVPLCSECRAAWDSPKSSTMGS